MATTLKAPYDGADYQARIFWNQAIRLLTEADSVTAVEYECRDAKSIDDVAVGGLPLGLELEYFKLVFSGKFGSPSHVIAYKN
jgi:hypothetical protein